MTAARRFKSSRRGNGPCARSPACKPLQRHRGAGSGPRQWSSRVSSSRGRGGGLRAGQCPKARCRTMSRPSRAQPSRGISVPVSIHKGRGTPGSPPGHLPCLHSWPSSVPPQYGSFMSRWRVVYVARLDRGALAVLGHRTTDRPCTGARRRMASAVLRGFQSGCKIRVAWSEHALFKKSSSARLHALGCADENRAGKHLHGLPLRHRVLVLPLAVVSVVVQQETVGR